MLREARLYLPYISPTSPLYLPCISLISPLYLPYISLTSPRITTAAREVRVLRPTYPYT